jgi:hypothetical protein
MFQKIIDSDSQISIHSAIITSKLCKIVPTPQGESPRPPALAGGG